MTVWRCGRFLFTCLILDLLSRRYALDEIPDIIVSHTITMIEGKEYELLCEITNVDPAQILTVKWYKGHILVNQTTFTKTTNNGPVNKTAKLQITANRTDDGAQYKCVAEQELGTPRTLTSRPLNITVHVKPIINETKLPSTVPVFRGYPVVLVCEAVGHPKPDVSWSPTTNVKVVGGNLTITDTLPDNLYTCTANNSAGNTTRIVTVVLKEDYLPLIAGLVAVTVAVISVIFIFIYSIYYKKAKMGHYSLKDAKPSAQNGHIAQNGKDNTIPMKKLSQSNIFA